MSGFKRKPVKDIEDTCKKIKLVEINFNSQRSSPPGYRKLSNLFMGEFDYMRPRFPQPEMQELFTRLENCDRNIFLDWLMRLQPRKKWTDAKKGYWFFEGEPIRGILAQMIGSCVRRKDGKLTQTANERQNILCNELGLESIQVADELDEDGKKDLMRECLVRKYNVPEYRELLLSTGDAILHEVPLRGRPNAWSYRANRGGGDWLGKLLMEIRDNIRAEPVGEIKVRV